MATKGIILAGGAGSRLYPLTNVVSKQLQPVYDKPMVYYPLTTLIESGIRDILLITTPQDLSHYQHLLNDGSQWGISIEYKIQHLPRGLAEAFIIGEQFIGTSDVMLILGDNIIAGSQQVIQRQVAGFFGGGLIFAYAVNDPTRYGVVELSNGQVVSIEEKPALPKSNYAIPGIYLFDHTVVEIAKDVKPSERGEVEITSVQNAYLAQKKLKCKVLDRGTVWLDAGTPASLHEASSYVHMIEQRSGIKLGCPEEAALDQGFLTLDQFHTMVMAMPQCEYRGYLLSVYLLHARE